MSLAYFPPAVPASFTSSCRRSSASARSVFIEIDSEMSSGSSSGRALPVLSWALSACAALVMPARALISCSASFASFLDPTDGSLYGINVLLAAREQSGTGGLYRRAKASGHRRSGLYHLVDGAENAPDLLPRVLVLCILQLFLQVLQLSVEAFDQTEHVGLQHCILGVHLLANSHDLLAVRAQCSRIALGDTLPVDLVGLQANDSVLPGVDAGFNGRLFRHERGQLGLVRHQKRHHRAVRGDEAFVLGERERGDEAPPGATVAWRVVCVCEELARRVDELDGHGCEVVEFGAPVVRGRVEVAEALQLRLRARIIEARKRALGAVERRRHEAGGDADAVEGAAVRPRDNGYPASVLGERERGGETFPASVGWRGAFRVCDDLARRVDEVDRLRRCSCGSAVSLRASARWARWSDDVTKV
eukprot:scaffold70245_cov64-Phaeocystis_antarctica.AAC.3